MRILYVSDNFPYPLTSGLLRHYHLIRGLAPRHEIDLLSMVNADYRDEHRAGIEPYVRRIETFRTVARNRSLLKKVTRRALDHLVLGGAEAASLAVAERARALHAAHPYDVILLTGRRPFPVAEVIGDTPLVVDLCDATSARLATNLLYASAPMRLVLRYQMSVARTNELRLIERSEHLLFASARDRDEVLEGSPRTPDATVLPNGVDHAYWERQSRTLGDEVVFSGAMQYPPNDDAARFLIGEVMPHVWRESPGTSVRIIGRDPTERLQALAADDARVTITGYVDDVRPHLERGAVYAAPLRFASGIQNKLLEAMSMEIPIITSPVAAAGLRDGEVEPPITIVENEPRRFAREVVAALGRVRDDPRPDEDARRFVVDRFRWDRAVQILEEVLEGVRRAA